MKAILRTGVLMLLFMVTHSAVAHHSFAAEFDAKQPVNLDGTVVKFEFMNPTPGFTWT